MRLRPFCILCTKEVINDFLDTGGIVANCDAHCVKRVHDLRLVWHLNYKSQPLWVVVMVSWGIALFEYWLAVPANRWGSAVYTAAELKTIQEVITFAVFVAFSIFYLGQSITLQLVLGLWTDDCWRSGGV